MSHATRCSNCSEGRTFHHLEFVRLNIIYPTEIKDRGLRQGTDNTGCGFFPLADFGICIELAGCTITLLVDY
jgi:hypothetical protein